VDYQSLLREAIQNSRYTLAKIADLVKEKSLCNTTREYLSRLQTGKNPPASDSLNEALAEVLNIDPTDLKAAAYLTKIPPEVIDRIIEIKTNSKEERIVSNPNLEKAEAAAPTTTSVDVMEVLENQLSVLTSIQNTTKSERLKIDLSTQIVDLVSSIVKTADVIDFKNRRYEKVFGEEIAKSAETIADLALERLTERISRSFRHSCVGVYDDIPESQA